MKTAIVLVGAVTLSTSPWILPPTGGAAAVSTLSIDDNLDMGAYYIHSSTGPLEVGGACTNGGSGDACFAGDAIVASGAVCFDEVCNYSILEASNLIRFEAGGAYRLSISGSSGQVLLGGDLNVSTYEIVSSSGPVELGGHVASTHGLGADDIIAVDAVEIDGEVHLDGIQRDVGATCVTGEFAVDTGGATTELCYCTTTDTWYCAALGAGPTD
jgi:hypothetical protein